ncbi:hypothetical protein JCM33374_g2379 [Metschnikowia sp. JCM 33374]|nr:hypothetical protein JCM33374_g2379 [Metschnikowia sp. JCM 33374]
MEMARAPKLVMLLLTAIVGVLLLVSRVNSHPSSNQTVKMASLHLDDSYILYFQSSSSQDPSDATINTLKALTTDYVAIIEHSLDGKILHQYETLVYGLSFNLDYTDKVYKAIGSIEVPKDVVKTTDDRLYEYLKSFKAAELSSSGITMTLERDKTMTTQEDTAGV